MELKERFEDAQVRVKALPSQGPQVLLQLYGLFKQANVGDVTGKRPGMLDVKGRAKYDAWASRQGMSHDAAMEEYVNYVDQLLASK